MKKKLTSRYIDTVTAPGPKRLDVYDQALTGFGVRVSTSGRKTWFCSTRVNGRMKRMKIGTYPALSLADAREHAKATLRDIQLGVEPTATTPALGDVVPQFIELYARPRNRGWREQQRLLEQKWCGLFTTPIDQIQRGAVVRILDQMIADGAPGRANNALATLKKLLNWCLDRGMIDINPIAGLKPPTKPKARDRVLTDPEISRFLLAAEDEGYPFGTLAKLLLLTGQRRGEVSEMRWSQVDFETATWTIPSERAKNGIAHDVPLSQPVIDILQGLPRFAGSDFVFTTTGKTPVSGFGRAKDRLNDAMGASDWRLHDLRRTAASGMARIGVAPHIIEKVLNHKSGVISGVAAVYNRYSYADEKCEALRLWSKEIQALTCSMSKGCGRSLGSLTSNETSIESLGFTRISSG
ncbi:tyrosine-type recombinase/integrase [Ovoidimarina sediminis]|uniref:tyrosine-type recombinase/integrase n=1 Tax=Ovoidimarina sediminis TaxID=3079856 RepID=UPI002911BB5E|nr:tyrosine-type recombinase/integrase [Rhodophyticola sp. MJ-SS7]MDU8945943.1 tyrosine-type recombinase/integrase [Rhodophyticola sp. MJ-SS7]